MGNFYFQTDTHNPWHNLAIEKYLSSTIGLGDVIFYLWQNVKTVVIGKNQNAVRECRSKLLEAEGGFLARRTTGGGAVYQDMGNLCFTFLASPEVYNLERQMQVVRNACESYGLHVHFSGRNDLITDKGVKFSGNAFTNTSQCRIHHGTLMVDVDLRQMKRYLTPSCKKLKAKGVKSVSSRVCNLRSLNPEITVECLENALKECFQKEYGSFTKLQHQSFQKSEISKIENLYASWEWRYGKSPDCEICHMKRFEWGEVEIWIKASGMRINEIKIYSDCLDIDIPCALEALLIGKKMDMEDVQEKDIFHVSASHTQREKIREVIVWLSASDT